MNQKPSLSRAVRARLLFRSLRFRILGILILCYLIPVLLLGGLAGSFLLRQLRLKTEAALSTAVSHSWDQTVQSVDRAVSLSRDATYDGELAEIWNRWNTGAIGSPEFLRQCRNYLDRKYGREELFGFALFFPVSQPELLAVTRSANAYNAATLQALRQYTAVLGDSLDTHFRFVSYRNQMYLIRNMLNLRMERFGMLILEVNRQELFSPLKTLQTAWNGSIAVRLDDYADPSVDWASLKPGLTDRQSENLLEYGIASSGESDYDFRMRLQLDRREQYREIYLFRSVSVLVYVLLIPIFILLARFVHSRITRPVTLLSDAARQIEEGNFGVTVPLRGGDELGDLGVSFSKMSVRLKELINKTYREEIELKNAQILALQSRINPHFINNALEDINWQARMDGSETASAMVASLSVLLNAAMGRKDSSSEHGARAIPRIVTLKEELEVADAYIFFVQQRFGPDLEFVRDVEESALPAGLPLLSIQPLLENAVEHGIAPAGRGRILLRARRTDRTLLIEIINSGQGIRPEDREKIDIALRGENAGPHLGLANIVNRLRLIYEDRVTIRVSTEPDGETAVRIEIPQEEESRR
ncbi:MAG: histidine kinase [Clostridia bacterium]|nr:histidine kinase [Clostridia bacterium]